MNEKQTGGHLHQSSQNKYTRKEEEKKQASTLQTKKVITMQNQHWLFTKELRMRTKRNLVYIRSLPIRKSWR